MPWQYVRPCLTEIMINNNNNNNNNFHNNTLLLLLLINNCIIIIITKKKKSKYKCFKNKAIKMAKHIQINKTKMKMKSDHIKTTKIFYIFINNTKTILMYYFSLLFAFVYWFYVSILPSFTHPHIIQTRNIFSELPKLIIWLQKTSNSITHAHHLGHFYFIWCFILYIYNFFSILKLDYILQTTTFIFWQRVTWGWVYLRERKWSWHIL